jgi:predicted metalloendopeptidase
MNEEAVEAAGTAPLEGVLDLCKQAREPEKRAEVLGKLYSQYGVAAFLVTYASPDKKDANHSICGVSQGGLGLPDRDYYFDEDKAEKREAYKVHIAKMMKLLDPSLTEDAATQVANSVYQLELSIAESHMTKTEKRDPKATYNKMAISHMKETLCDNKFDFDAYFSAAGKSS